MIKPRWDVRAAINPRISEPQKLNALGSLGRNIYIYKNIWKTIYDVFRTKL